MEGEIRGHGRRTKSLDMGQRDLEKSNLRLRNFAQMQLEADMLRCRHSPWVRIVGSTMFWVSILQVKSMLSSSHR